MATALEVIRRGIMHELGGLLELATTSTGDSGGNTFVSTAIGEYPDDYLKDKFCLLQGSNTRRRIIGNTQSSGTGLVRPEFAAQVASSTDLEIFDLDPDWITQEVNQQILNLFPAICVVVEDESITIVADTYEYALPSEIVGDAFLLFEEPDPSTDPWRPLLDWEYDPVGHNIRFNYPLTAGRSIRAIGIGHLEALADFDDELGLDAPQLDILYARVIRGLADKLSGRNTGVASDRFEEVAEKWEARTQGRLEIHMTAWPNQIVKLKGWTG